jgi:hypothetical protein
MCIAGFPSLVGPFWAKDTEKPTYRQRARWSTVSNWTWGTPYRHHLSISQLGPYPITIEQTWKWSTEPLRIYFASMCGKLEDSESGESFARNCHTRKSWNKNRAAPYPVKRHHPLEYVSISYVFNASWYQMETTLAAFLTCTIVQC